MSVQIVRAKFWVKEIVNHHNGQKDAPQPVTIKLAPVYDDANKDWSKYTPQGQIEMMVTNPVASAMFELGKAYFVEFTSADREA